MKKLLATLMAAAMLFSASACSSKTDDDDDEKNGSGREETTLAGYWAGEFELDGIAEELVADYLNLGYKKSYDFEFDIDAEPVELYLHFADERVEYLLSGDQLCGVLKDIYTDILNGISNNKDYTSEIGMSRREISELTEDIDSMTASTMFQFTSDIFAPAGGNLEADGVFVFDRNTYGASYKQNGNSIEAELTDISELELDFSKNTLKITKCTADKDKYSSDELNDKENEYREKLFKEICGELEGTEFKKVYLKDIKSKYEGVFGFSGTEYYTCLDCGVMIPYTDWRCEDCARDAECVECGAELETTDYDCCSDCSGSYDGDYAECIDCGTVIPYWDYRCEECVADARCRYCGDKLGTDDYSTCDYCTYHQYGYDYSYSYGGKYDDYFNYDNDYNYYY